MYVKAVAGSSLSRTSQAGVSQVSCSRIADVRDSGPYRFSTCRPFPITPVAPIPLLPYDVS